MKNFVRILLASTALVSAAAPVLAQSGASDESTFLSPLIVSGAAFAGGIGDPYDQPKAVSTVSKDEIDQFGGQNLDNALRAEPGVFTHDNPQNPGLAVNVRGLGDYGRVTMEIDGVRQNFRFTGHDAAGMTFVDPALLAGVDITRGLADGVGGAGALAGVADFRTLDVDDLIIGNKDWGAETSVTAGTNGDGFAEMAAGAFRVNDTFAILGAISKRNNSDYANAGGITVQDTGQDELSGLAKAEITPNAATKITLSGLLYGNTFAANGYEQTMSNQTYSAKLDYTPADNDLIDLHAGLNFNATKMQYTGVEDGITRYYAMCGPPTFCLTDFYPETGRVIDDQSIGANAVNTSRGKIGDVGIKSTYGLEYNHDHADVTEPSGAPGINPTGTADLASAFESTTLSYGLLDATGGLRATYFSANGTVPLSPANADPSFSGSSTLSAASLDPSVTLALRAADWFEPYISYAHTFRPPTVSELYASGDHPGDFLLFGANPNLTPETADTVEIGANFRKDGIVTADDSVRVKVDYFHTSIQNYIVGSIDDTVYPELWHFVNASGTSVLQGVEVQAAYDAGGYFASLAYTHTDSDLPADNVSSVTYIPTDILTATLGFRLLDDHSLTLGGRLHAVSETKVGPDDYGSPQPPLPGYGLVDLFANYKLQNGIELSAGISNVFNVAYTPALSTTPDLSTSGGTGRGRTFEVSAKAKF